MKFSKVLENRRSIRSFKDTPVKKEDLKKMIKAALMAPSWKNSESARYYVVSDDKELAVMKENCIGESNAAKVANAPVLIVTGYAKGISGCLEGLAVNEMGQYWGFFDLGLAVENMLLCAYSLHLGTLVMGMRNEAAIRKQLDIPENIMIGPVIAVGYPDEEPEAPLRKRVRDVATFD